MTRTQITETITYRKTKAGEWVAFGPASAIREGSVVVTKKDGSTKTEHIARVGKPFTANGREMRYGYLAPRPSSSPRRPVRSRRHICDECGDWVDSGTTCWETGLTH